MQRSKPIIIFNTTTLQVFKKAGLKKKNFTVCTFGCFFFPLTSRTVRSESPLHSLHCANCGAFPYLPIMYTEIIVHHLRGCGGAVRDARRFIAHTPATVMSSNYW